MRNRRSAAFTYQSLVEAAYHSGGGAFMNFLTGLVVLALLYSCVAGFLNAKIAGFFDGCPLIARTLQVGDEL